MAQVVTPSNLGQEFELGTTVTDKITIKVDGTSVERASDGTLNAAPPMWDNVTKIITFPSQNGAPAQEIDLSQFVADIYVNGGSYDPALMTLVLSDNDATTPDVVVNLSAMLGVSTDAGQILTNGADGKPFLDEATITNIANNCTDAFGVNIFKAFPI